MDAKQSLADLLLRTTSGKSDPEAVTPLSRNQALLKSASYCFFSNEEPKVLVEHMQQAVQRAAERGLRVSHTPCPAMPMFVIAHTNGARKEKFFFGLYHSPKQSPSGKAYVCALHRGDATPSSSSPLVKAVAAFFDPSVGEAKRSASPAPFSPYCAPHPLMDTGDLVLPKGYNKASYNKPPLSSEPTLFKELLCVSAKALRNNLPSGVQEILKFFPALTQDDKKRFIKEAGVVAWVVAHLAPVKEAEETAEDLSVWALELLLMVLPFTNSAELAERVSVPLCLLLEPQGPSSVDGVDKHLRTQEALKHLVYVVGPGSFEMHTHCEEALQRSLRLRVEYGLFPPASGLV